MCWIFTAHVNMATFRLIQAALIDKQLDFYSPKLPSMYNDVSKFTPDPFKALNHTTDVVSLWNWQPVSEIQWRFIQLEHPPCNRPPFMQHWFKWSNPKEQEERRRLNAMFDVMSNSDTLALDAYARGDYRLAKQLENENTIAAEPFRGNVGHTDDNNANQNRISIQHQVVRPTCADCI